MGDRKLTVGVASRPVWSVLKQSVFISGGLEEASLSSPPNAEREAERTRIADAERFHATNAARRKEFGVGINGAKGVSRASHLRLQNMGRAAGTASIKKSGKANGDGLLAIRAVKL